MSVNIINDVKAAFKNILKDVDNSSSEFDIRGRLILHLVRKVWGYTGKDYQDEKKELILRFTMKIDFEFL